jgi:hypothetical protein
MAASGDPDDADELVVLDDLEDRDTADRPALRGERATCRMPERPEPLALPKRHTDATPAEPSTPGADPRVLRRVAEALDDATSPRSATDRR